jgi:hypothetical protein
LTGRYQTRFGHEFNPAGGKQGMPIDQTTVAQRFRAAIEQALAQARPVPLGAVFRAPGIMVVA